MSADPRLSIFASAPPMVLFVLLFLTRTAPVPEAPATPVAEQRSAVSQTSRAAARSVPPARKPASLRESTRESAGWKALHSYLTRAGCLSGSTTCTFDAIIVTVADPLHSSAQWQTDRQLQTLQTAAAAAGYALDRYVLDEPAARARGTAAPGDERARPPANAEAPPREPGLVIYRGVHVPAAAERIKGISLKILALLLVPEMPTSGVERDAFLRAAAIVTSLRHLRQESGAAQVPWLRILGPTYSGSAASLRMAVDESFARICQDPEVKGPSRRPTRKTRTAPTDVSCQPQPSTSSLLVQIVSGSATTKANIKATLEKPQRRGVTIAFTRTVDDDRALLKAMRDYLARMNPDWGEGRRMALLVEANTGWGAELAAASLGSPSRNEVPGSAAKQGQDVADRALFKNALILTFPLHIAQEEAPRPDDSPALPSYASSLTRKERLQLAETGTPKDRLPQYSPHLSESARDLTLGTILHQLERGRKDVVGILATDIRDHLFLARAINKVAPNVQLFGTEPDILLLHRQYLPYNRGSLWASSFPLQPHLQRLRGDTQTRVQFTSMSQQGTFNALATLIGRPDLRMDTTAPSFDGVTPSSRAAGPWVLAVGQNGFVPLSTVADTTQGGMLTSGHASHYVFATWYEKGFWNAMPWLALIGVIVVAITQVRPMRACLWLSPPHMNGLVQSRPPASLARELARAVWPPARGGTADKADVAELSLELEHAVLRIGCATGGLLVAQVLFFMLWQVFGTVRPWLARLLTAGFAVSGVVLVLLSTLALIHGVRRAFHKKASHVFIDPPPPTHAGGVPPARASLIVRIGGRLPDLAAIAVLVLSLWLIVRLEQYLVDLSRLPLSTRVLASDRFFSLDSLLSPLPQLGAILALSLLWVTWSLRTLFYQSIPGTDAAALVEGLTGYDCPDRRLTRNIVSTLDTTLQPTGWFAAVALLAVSVFCVVGVPRTYSLEGASFRSVLIVGTMLGVLAISLELGQASWLAVQVKRLLERIRIHPVYPALAALKDAPVDWRPSLQQPQSPHRLLLRLLPQLAAPGGMEHAGRMPILRTTAWRVALGEAAAIAQYLPCERRFRWPQHEPLLALVTAVFVQTLVTRVVRGFGIAVMLIAVLITGHLVSGFPGRSIAVLIDVGLLTGAALLSIRVLLTFERDHVMSTLWNGTPGELNLSSGLVWRALLYGGVPVVTIVGALFPEVGGSALVLIEPLRQLLPAQ